MLTNLKSISEDEMLLDWGMAEAKTRCAELLGTTLADRIVDGEIPSNDDRLAIIRAIINRRAPLLQFFLRKPVRWCKADFPLHELSQAHLIRYFESVDPFKKLKTVGELAGMVSDYKIKGFDPKKVRGHPILVAPYLDGPWCLIEGTTRSCEYLRRNMEPLDGRNTIPVIVGIYPKVTEWLQWR